MKDFFQRLFGKKGSGSIAKERLQLVLIHDRTDISPELLNSLRTDLIEVISKYMEIDSSKIEMDLDRADRSVALVANMPIIRVKRGSKGEE